MESFYDVFDTVIDHLDDNQVRNIGGNRFIDHLYRLQQIGEYLQGQIFRLREDSEKDRYTDG